MSRIRLSPRVLVWPAIAVLLLVLWLVQQSPELIYAVPMRSQTQLTNPYPVAIAVGYAVAIALSRSAPIAGIAITGGGLLLQLLFWPARFSLTSWSAYLGLIALAVAFGMSERRIVARIGLAFAIAYALAVSALLNFPFVSMSGQWGIINGKPSSSPDVLLGFDIWAVVAAGLAVGGWFAGRRIARGLATTRPMAVSSVPVSGPVRSVDATSSTSDPLAPLSARESEIFFLAAEGMSNAEIAASANIEESTVKTHLNAISTKLGLTSRTQLVAFAYRTGLLTPVGH